MSDWAEDALNEKVNDLGAEIKHLYKRLEAIKTYLQKCDELGLDLSKDRLRGLANGDIES